MNIHLHALTSILSFAIGLVLLLRWLVRGAGRGLERVLVVGSGPLARRLVAEIDARPELGWSLRLLPDPGGHADHRLADAARAGVDRVIVATADRHVRLPLRALLGLRGRGVRIEEAAAVYERLTGKMAIDALRPGDLLFGHGFRSSRWEQLGARVLSLTAAALGLLVAGPVIAILACIVKRDSPGPAFFRQKRIGLDGRPFELYKLRTMRPGPSGSEWERDNRARLTRVGGWLRRSHLDELPQLWNILRGDMNLVGPRPHPLVNAEMFHRRIPFYELRSLVPPGLTGWAQVRYRYANSLEEETEKMCYDLYYIRHRSLWLDLRVLPATVLASFGRRRRARSQAPRYPVAVPTPIVDRRSGRS
jgi:lipopolysaccharide/colanic/teichoic acid biosynthesis glycosyltransferase